MFYVEVGVMVNPLFKPMVLGFTIGVIAGILSFIVFSTVTGYNLFGVKWSGPKIYYVKMNLYYIYLHIYRPYEETPLIGDKVLLEYIIIVRVQNPYNDIIVAPHKLTVNLYSYLELRNSTNRSWGYNRRSSDCNRVLFDAWREHRLTSYSGVDKILLDGGVLNIDSSVVNNWLFGDSDTGSRKYYVVTGVVETPISWLDKFSNDTIQFYVVLEFQGRTVHGDDGVYGQVVEIVCLNSLGNYTYVYNGIDWTGGFELTGSQIRTFYGGLWP